MRRSSWAVLGMICALAGVLICLRTAGRTQLSEEDQVHSLVAKGQTAIERKDLRGALSRVSRDYSDPAGFNFETLRLQAIQAFRTDDSYKVVLENTSIRVQGDDALVEADVSVAVISDNKKMHWVFTGPMNISLRNEKSKRWVVVPVKTWKVISIGGLPNEFTE